MLLTEAQLHALADASNTLVEDPWVRFADDAERLLRWSESQTGQHLELGIAEVNTVGLLGELGATWSRWGERLIPIATFYDPFVGRALEPWSFGLYAGGQSILVGTPSGVTLAAEGGAHQSVTTPSIGLEQPGCVAWEPAFAILPEVVAASEALAEDGVTAGVVCLTSPDLVFRSFQQRGSRVPGVGSGVLDLLLPPHHPAPLVTVLDGHPHTLGFLAGARGDRIRCLGVSDFGQSSSLPDAYRIHGLDAGSIAAAALDLLGR